MKYLLLILFFLPLTACQDSGPDTAEKAGYVAGYQLICGYSWNAENRFVVDKEFARDFLNGAIVCAQEHPERARRVLGLANERQTVPVREPDKRMGAAPEDAQQPKPLAKKIAEQQKAPVPGSHPRAPVETAKAPARLSETPKRAVKAPVAKNASAKTAKTLEKAAKVPAKTAKTAKTVKAPAKSAESSATARGAPVEERTSVRSAKPTVTTVAAPAPKPVFHPPPVEETRETQNRRRKPTSDYDRFMGRW